MKKEIIKPFDLASYKNGAKIQTRDGNEVRIICTDAKRPSYPVVALVKVDDNRECIISYTTEGKEYYSSADSDPNDLVIVEEEEEPEFWLEKQDTQPRYNIGDILCDKLCTTLNKEAQPNMEIVDIKNGMYICDKGSFPVSQQDEYELVSKKIDMKPVDSVSNELREASLEHARNEMMSTTFPNNMTFELAYNFEEGAKWDAAQKPTWSKDDDDNIGMIESRLIDLLSYTREDNSLTKRRKNSIKEEVVGYVNWLTSLKDRSTWKPSDAQMIALNDVITNRHLSNANERILKGL